MRMRKKEFFFFFICAARSFHFNDMLWWWQRQRSFCCFDIFFTVIVMMVITSWHVPDNLGWLTTLLWMVMPGLEEGSPFPPSMSALLWCLMQSKDLGQIMFLKSLNCNSTSCLQPQFNSNSGNEMEFKVICNSILHKSGGQFVWTCLCLQFLFADLALRDQVLDTWGLYREL